MTEFTPRKLQLAERAVTMQEVPDPTPVEIPTGLGEGPVSFIDAVKQAVIMELNRQAIASGEHGTYEEEDDFSDDDPEERVYSDHQYADMEREWLSSQDPAFFLEDETPPNEIVPPSEGTLQSQSEGVLNEAPAPERA